MQDIWTETDKIIKEKNIPLTMVLELTRRCNLACRHCYNLKDNAELSFGQIKEIVRQLRRAGCLFAVLTGGEVFTRPDFLEVASFIRKSGIDIKIFTNGTLITPSVARQLKELCPSEVAITILGAIASTHDKITRVDGSFKRSLSAIKMLKEEGIPVNLKCTLMKDNFHEHNQVMDLAESLGLVYTIDPLVSPKDDGSKDVLSNRITPEQLEDFYWRQLPDLEEIPANQEYFLCEAGRTFGSISATGEVYPCVQLPLKAGNVFERELGDIWADSELLNKMRQTKREDLRVCADCEIYRYCKRCPGVAYLEDGDLFGPSRIACFFTRIYARFQETRQKI